MLRRPSLARGGDGASGVGSWRLGAKGGGAGNSACDGGASDFTGAMDANDGIGTTKIGDDECDDDSGSGGTGKDMLGMDELEAEPANGESGSGSGGEALPGPLAGKCVPDGKAR